MTQSSDVAVGQQATAEHYNKLRADVLSRLIAAGQYTGNNADDRQITVGFKCSLVVIMGTGAQAGNQWILIPNATVSHNTAPQHDSDVTRTRLHASDGFIVDKDGPRGTVASNAAAVVYYYWSISEMVA